MDYAGGVKFGIMLTEMHGTQQDTQAAIAWLQEIIENIFAWPGVGRYAVSAIFNRDYPVIQCFTLMMVVVFVVCNLIVDLLNAALDPRIRRHEGAHA